MNNRGLYKNKISRLLDILEEANNYYANNKDINNSNLARYSNEVMNNIRELYLYIRNDYMLEFYWWYNVPEKELVFKDVITEDDKNEYYIKKTAQATFLDKLAPFWERMKESNYVLVPVDIIKKKSRKVTINLDDNRVKIELLDDEHEGLKQNEYSKIYAYSFGPWNAEEYFKSKERIVIINTEPYMESSDLLSYTKENSKLGHHNQALEYDNFSIIEADTIKSNVEFCTQLLSKMGKSITHDEVMKKHMCILEHNFFPGLAFEIKDSDEELIKKWAELNQKLLEKLLIFYRPTIVLGHRNLLGYACGGSVETFNQALGGTKIFLEISNAKFLDRKIIYTEKIKVKSRYKFAGIVDENDTIWIGGLHFSRSFWTRKTNAPFIIDWIINRINSQNQP